MIRLALAALALSFAFVQPAMSLTPPQDPDFAQLQREYQQELDLAMRTYNSRVAETQRWYEQRVLEIRGQKFDKDADYGNRQVAEATRIRDEAFQAHKDAYYRHAEWARSEYYRKGNNICRRQTGQDCIWQ